MPSLGIAVTVVSAVNVTGVLEAAKPMPVEALDQVLKETRASGA